MAFVSGKTLRLKPGECGTVVTSYQSHFIRDPYLFFVEVRWESDGFVETYDQRWLEHAPLDVDAILAAVCDGMKQTN